MEFLAGNITERMLPAKSSTVNKKILLEQYKQ